MLPDALQFMQVVQFRTAASLDHSIPDDDEPSPAIG